jgi:predicted MFS family arabinose efflux permease
VIADVIAPERRGRAMGTVMGAFSIASVFGVPAGLELARLGGWRMPFFGVASLGLMVLIAAWVLLPPLRLHLDRGPPSRVAGPWTMLKQPAVRLSLLSMACTMMSVFAVVPNLATYLQFNCGYPRARLGLLYLVGGVVSFFTMRVAGRLSDRFGTTTVATAGTSVFALVLVIGFVPTQPLVPILPLFVGFMLAGSIRMVPMSALSTRVPSASERARFMSVQSAMQHIASATGAALSSLMLGELPGGRLVGMDHVAWFSIALAVVLPFLIWSVEKRVKESERLRSVESSIAAPTLPH